MAFMIYCKYTQRHTHRDKDKYICKNSLRFMYTNSKQKPRRGLIGLGAGWEGEYGLGAAVCGHHLDLDAVGRASSMFSMVLLRSS